MAYLLLWWFGCLVPCECPLELGLRDNQMSGEKGWKRRSGWSNGMEGERRHRQQLAVYHRPRNANEGKTGRRAEDLHLLYLRPWLVWLAGFQEESAGVENWDELVSVGNEGWREKIYLCDPLGWWQVTCSRCSAVGLGTRLGDWIWRNVGRRDLQLVYLFSLLILHFVIKWLQQL